MFNLATFNPTMFNPFKLLLRMIVVTAIVLALAQHFQRALVEPLLPLMRATLEYVQDDFAVQSLDIDSSGGNEVIRLHANLARPTYVNGRTFYPIGWNTSNAGGMEIRLTVGGAIQYSLLTLIAVLTWPARHWRTQVNRIVIALPIFLGLILLNTSTTFLAELWIPIHDEWVPDMLWPLLVSSKMLMGGGGLILGLLGGVSAISLSSLTPASSLLSRENPKLESI